ncbi:MAG: flavin-containing monooxygenase [Marmoricola sp.]
MTDSSAPSVIVIGAGFGGITIAARLLELGITDLTVLEKQPGVGGVWRANTYPGAACDVPSSLYSWSFAPSADWSYRYAKQPQILDYIEAQTAALGVAPYVHADSEVVAATWDDGEHRWEVELADGERLSADVLISAVGQLSRPAVPEIPGAPDFAGPMFHSAEWNHDVDLRGRRVAVIGTGASAIQFVPAIAGVAAAVTVFQRSAPYVVPKADREYTRIHHALFQRIPGSQRLGRKGTFVLSEQLNHTLTEGGWLSRILMRAWRLHLRHQVKDPGLRRRLVPDYPMGCKRLLFSNDWYRTLDRQDVEVVTEGIAGIERAGIRDATGALHEADVVIFGTGFKATQFLAPMEIRGREGVRLADVWKSGAYAYFGISVPEFPNLFVMYGPNTNLGGSSIIGMLEAQAEHICQAISRLRRAGRGAAISVTPEALATFDAEVQERLSHSAWTGCSSWYREAGGRITTNWPGLVREYVARTTAPLDDDDYRLAAGVASGVGQDGVDRRS